MERQWQNVERRMMTKSINASDGQEMAIIDYCTAKIHDMREHLFGITWGRCDSKPENARAGGLNPTHSTETKI